MFCTKSGFSKWYLESKKKFLKGEWIHCDSSSFYAKRTGEHVWPYRLFLWVRRFTVLYGGLLFILSYRAKIWQLRNEVPAGGGYRNHGACGKCGRVCDNEGWSWTYRARPHTFVWEHSPDWWYIMSGTVAGPAAGIGDHHTSHKRCVCSDKEEEGIIEFPPVIIKRREWGKYRCMTANRCYSIFKNTVILRKQNLHGYSDRIPWRFLLLKPF